MVSIYPYSQTGEGAASQAVSCSHISCAEHSYGFFWQLLGSQSPKQSAAFPGRAQIGGAKWELSALRLRKPLGKHSCHQGGRVTARVRGQCGWSYRTRCTEQTKQVVGRGAGPGRSVLACLDLAFPWAAAVMGMGSGLLRMTCGWLLGSEATGAAFPFHKASPAQSQQGGPVEQPCLPLGPLHGVIPLEPCL